LLSRSQGSVFSRTWALLNSISVWLRGGVVKELGFSKEDAFRESFPAEPIASVSRRMGR
jgi:hypothetical protein